MAKQSCKLCDGTGMVYRNPNDMPKGNYGFVAAYPCVCTIKEKKEMLKDVFIGSTVSYLDDTGKYPCIKHGNIVSKCGTHYIVNDQRLHHNELLESDDDTNKALYQATKTRLNTLQALANQLGRHIADESTKERVDD